jgi:Immunity protein 52
MNERPFSIGIYYGLPRRRETPTVIGTKFLSSLDALSSIDPLFAKWKVLDLPAMDTLPLAVARPRIAAMLEKNVVRNDFDQPEPTSGYSAIGVTDTAIPSRIVTLSVGAGGVVRDEMMLHVGDFLYPTDPLIVKYSVFREALLATSGIWQPTWGAVSAFRGDYAEEPMFPGEPLFPYSAFHIPWIVYLSPARTVGLALPAEIRSERVPGGGLLLTVTDDPFDPINPEHLRRARILTEMMLTHIV